MGSPSCGSSLPGLGGNENRQQGNEMAENQAFR
jgi:hypothetical protein